MKCKPKTIRPPDTLVEYLSVMAAANRRSLNQEIILRLEESKRMDSINEKPQEAATS